MGMPLTTFVFMYRYCTAPYNAFASIISGQFVSSDSKGCGALTGGSFGGGRFGGGRGGYGGLSGIGRESRENTLRNARNKIKALGQQLSLRQDRIDMAFNFFRMALSRYSRIGLHNMVST